MKQSKIQFYLFIQKKTLFSTNIRVMKKMNGIFILFATIVEFMVLKDLNVVEDVKFVDV